VTSELAQLAHWSVRPKTKPCQLRCSERALTVGQKVSRCFQHV